jgi:hypothetical protein
MNENELIAAYRDTPIEEELPAADAPWDENMGVPTERVELDELVTAYAVARATREEASDREKRLRETEARVEGELFNALERLGLRSVRHRTLGLFSLNDMATAIVTDEVLLREWAEMEMPEILLPNRQRLGKVVRDALKEGEALPPGTDVSFYRKINWRRGGV